MNKKKTNILFQPIRRKNQKKPTTHSSQKQRGLKAFIFIWVSFAIGGYIGLVIGYNMPKNNNSTIAQAPEPIKTMVTKPDVAKLREAVNTERTKNGLPVLALDERLGKSAESKCQDMVKRNYWGHDSPEGTEPWVFIQDQAVLYRLAGENLAYGYSDSHEAVQGWMNSEGHRANILNATYNTVGYGVCFSSNFQGQGMQYVIVQHLTEQ